MSGDVEIVLESFPEEGGQLVLVDAALALAMGVTARSLAVELRRSAPAMLGSALATLKVDKNTKAVRFRAGDVELTLMQALVHFDGARPLGVLCAVRPEYQRYGERAVAKLVAQVRARMRGLQ
jgi:hypothetical protein